MTRAFSARITYIVSILACCGAVGLSQGPSPSNNGVALVIGNTRYSVGTLSNASQDAQDIAKSLTNLGFIVTLKQDVDLSDLNQAINTFGKAARLSGKTALFYYSGHGLQVNGEDYLIPTDMTTLDAGTITHNAVSLQSVFDSIGMRTSPSIVILDACRVNPFLPNIAWVKGLAIPGNPAPNSLIAFSTAPGTVAADGVGTHSPYTRALLRYLGMPGQNTSELFDKVRSDVKANTDEVQVPWESTSLSSEVLFRDPVYIYGQFSSADDDALILLDGREVLDWNQDGNSKGRIQLHGGLNEIRVMVYNQRSYTGGIPGLGGHLPEGWNYGLTLTRSDGSSLVPPLSAREDLPADNGPHHGKLFTVCLIKILLDESSGMTSIQSFDPNVWRE
jgi:hypothetical protein